MDEGEEEWIEEKMINELCIVYRWNAWLLTGSPEDLSVDVCSLSE